MYNNNINTTVRTRPLDEGRQPAIILMEYLYRSEVFIIIIYIFFSLFVTIGISVFFFSEPESISVFSSQYSHGSGTDATLLSLKVGAPSRLPSRRGVLSGPSGRRRVIFIQSRLGALMCFSCSAEEIQRQNH